jgi:hypothetical protein
MVSISGEEAAYAPPLSKMGSIFLFFQYIFQLSLSNGNLIAPIDIPLYLGANSQAKFMNLSTALSNIL